MFGHVHADQAWAYQCAKCGCSPNGLFLSPPLTNFPARPAAISGAASKPSAYSRSRLVILAPFTRALDAPEMLFRALVFMMARAGVALELMTKEISRFSVLDLIAGVTKVVEFPGL
jgi:hypothetical protein